MRSRYQYLRRSFAAAALAALVGALPVGASAQSLQRTYATNPGDPGSYNSRELVESGHQFFGSASRGLALALQEAIRRWGEPNGYILGQEASGAFFGGVRFGEGKLFTRNAGERRIFWQGPSLGFDVGGEGARTMMLVYNMPFTDAIYRRFAGVDGSAYFIGGFGVSVGARAEGGVGARPSGPWGGARGA